MKIAKKQQKVIGTGIVSNNTYKKAMQVN